MSTDDQFQLQTTEHEIKLTGSKQALLVAVEGLKATTGGTPPTRLLRSTYFDTAEHDLWHKGIVLRVRDMGEGRKLLCVKTEDTGEADPFLRTECEVPIRRRTPQLSLLPAAVMSKLLQLIGSKPLVPLFSTNVKRTAFTVATPGANLEVACDEGVIVAGRKRQAIAEIEIEIKSGPAAALRDFTREFCVAHGLSLCTINKSGQGFALLAGEQKPSTGASRITLEKNMSARAAAAAILSATLLHFLQNWDPLRRDGSPESIHQLRVALRRMRSAFSTFKPLLDGTEFTFLTEEARRLANRFAVARKCDVFLQSFGTVSFGDSVPEAECNAFSKAITSLRKTACADARATLDDPATTSFVLRLQDFLETLTEAPTESAQPVVTAEDYARDALAALARRAMKRGRKITKRSPEELHRLRIALKKLRYGIGFFGDVADGSRNWRRVNKSTEALQETLGHLNDLAETQVFLASVPGLASLRLARCLGFVLGWHARDMEGHRATLKPNWDKLEELLAP